MVQIEAPLQIVQHLLLICGRMPEEDQVQPRQHVIRESLDLPLSVRDAELRRG